MQPMINKWSASSLRLVSTPRALICNKKCTNLCTYLKYTGWSTNFRIHHQHCYIVLLLCFLLLYLLHFTSFNFVVALCSCSSLTISLTLYTTSCLVVSILGDFGSFDTVSCLVVSVSGDFGWFWCDFGWFWCNVGWFGSGFGWCWVVFKWSWVVLGGFGNFWSGFGWVWREGHGFGWFWMVLTPPAAWWFQFWVISGGFDTTSCLVDLFFSLRDPHGDNNCGRIFIYTKQSPMTHPEDDLPCDCSLAKSLALYAMDALRSVMWAIAPRRGTQNNHPPFDDCSTQRL